MIRSDEAESSGGLVKTVSNKSRYFEVLDFALALPPAPASGARKATEPGLAQASPDENGIVGVITILSHKSVMIWLGWGNVRSFSTLAIDDSSDGAAQRDSHGGIGQSATRSMGPLMVSMPRSRYAGAFSMETASSKLIGSDSSESEMVARHMASRLSHKLGVAVFVSCSFDEHLAQGMDADEALFDEVSLQQRAATAAEQEIYRLLKSRLK